MKIICLALLINTIGYTMNSSTPISEPKRHSTIDLKTIIVDALGREGDHGLAWVIQGKVFSINIDKFHSYYNAKSGSSCKWISLKNRLTLSKSGFELLFQTPKNYDKLYTHESWMTSDDKPKCIEKCMAIYKKQSEKAKPENLVLGEQLDHDTYNLAVPANNQETNNFQPNHNNSINFLDMISDLDNLIDFLTEGKEHALNDTVLFKLEKISRSYYPDYSDLEKGNWRILLEAERLDDSPVGYSSKPAIKRFFIRYGKWPFTVINIRNLVSSCAKAYHGLINKQQAEEAFSGLDEENTYFLIRVLAIDESKQTKDPIGVFAISYRHKKNNYDCDKPIEHICIYSNGIQLCIINDKNECEFYSNIKDILDRVGIKESKGIKSKQFTDFLPQFKIKAKRDERENFVAIKKIKKI